MGTLKQPLRSKRPGRRLLGGLITACSVLALLSGVAVASTVNTRSDHAALRAYRAYMHSLVAGEGSAAAADRLFATTVKTTCGGSLDKSTIAKIGGPQAYAFGVEIGGDLAIRYAANTVGAFNRLAARLTALTWTKASAVDTIVSFVNAERAVLRLRPSNLCHDWWALGEHPKRTPTATTRFDQRFSTTSRLAIRRDGALLHLFERYEAAGDTGLINAINGDLSQYATAADRAQTASAKAIRGALGLPR